MREQTETFNYIVSKDPLADPKIYKFPRDKESVKLFIDFQDMLFSRVNRVLLSMMLLQTEQRIDFINPTHQCSELMAAKIANIQVTSLLKLREHLLLNDQEIKEFVVNHSVITQFS